MGESLGEAAFGVNVPVDGLERMFSAVQKVQERMLRTSHVLKGADVPFAVVGGNAVAIWVESIDDGAGRNTRDVDILIRRSGLRPAIDAMRSAGFKWESIHGVNMFLDVNDMHPGRAVHVLIAGELVRPGHVYPAPEIENLKYSPDGVPAIGLIELLTMKLQAARAIDGAHIIDMHHVGLITDDVIAKVPKDLEGRLREVIAREPCRWG